MIGSPQNLRVGKTISSEEAHISKMRHPKHTRTYMSRKMNVRKFISMTSWSIVPQPLIATLHVVEKDCPIIDKVLISQLVEI
jgi:hypothetical protein